MDSRSFEKSESTGANTVSPPRRSRLLVLLATSDCSAVSLQSFIKHKKTFQQLFPDIGKEEELIHCKLNGGAAGF